MPKPKDRVSDGLGLRRLRGIPRQLRMRPILMVLLALELIASCLLLRTVTPASSIEPIAAGPPTDPPYAAKLTTWPPDRPMFTDELRSKDAALNSTNPVPGYGDERLFVRLRPAEAVDSPYRSTLRIEPRLRYTASIRFHNSGRSGTLASNTRVRLWFPAVVKGSAALQAVISSDTASPPEVWSSAVATLPTAKDNIALRYIPDSAWLHADGFADRVPIDMNSLASGDGALVGCHRLDGLLPGGCSGEVTFDFVAAQPAFTIEGWLAAAGSKEFSDEAAVKPGGEVTVKARYLNTGTVEQDNVVIAISRPPGCASVVPGTTYAANSFTGGHWTLTNDDMKPSGLNYGNYSPGGGVYVKFNLKVDSIDEIRKNCDPSFPENGSIWLAPFVQITANTDNGSKGTANNGHDESRRLLIRVLGPSQALP